MVSADPWYSSVAALESAVGSLPPERVWAWYTRGLSLMFAWCCCILGWQITAVASSQGIFPVKARFERIRADFKKWQRFMYFPSWLHLNHSDWLLPRLLYAAGLGGLLLVWTGVASRLGLFLAWSVYLSYANLMNFMYPWDCLLLEMGFLSLFLPSLQWVGTSWLAVSAPAPLLAFSMRYLLWRLMFGFGKFKFIGMKLSDLSYLQGFLINQPIPTVLGWAMHKLPLPVHVASYLFLFLVEIPGPFLYFVCGWPRLLGMGLVILLQIGINLTGTFGYFNALTTVLSLGLMDTRGSLLDDFQWAHEMDFGAAPARAMCNVILAFLLVLHCVAIPFNSWCSQAFLHWPALNLTSGTGQQGFAGRFLRLLSPFHMSHAFGVFFPHSSPYIKWIPLIEGTDSDVIDDGASEEEAAAQRAAGAVHATEAVWSIYTYKFMVTDPQICPRFVAPYHPRVEHAILYEAMGLGPQTFLSPVTTADPYEFQPAHMLGQVCAALLRENAHAEELFRAVPFGRRSAGGKRARAMRVSMYCFRPTAVAELIKTGTWWQRFYSHPHIPAMTLRQVQRGDAGQLRLREPECFHPEMYIWQTRTVPVQKLLAKLDSGAPLSASMAAHDEQELRSLREGARGAATRSAVAPALRAHKAVSQGAASSSTMAPIYSFRSVELSDADVVSFWTDFVAPLSSSLASLRCPQGKPLYPAQNGSRHAGLSDSVLSLPANHGFKVDKPWDEANPSRWSEEVRRLYAEPRWAQLSREQRDKHEKVLARLALLLLTRLLPLYHGPAADEPTRSVETDNLGTTRPSTRLACKEATHLHLPSFFHLHAFCQHVIGHGLDTYERVLRDPRTAAPLMSSWCVESGLFLSAFFHYDVLAYQSRKRRMGSRQAHPSGMEAGGVLPGFLPIYYSFLEAQFVPRAGDRVYEETFPLLEQPASACDGWKVHTKHMGYTSPGRQAAPEESKKVA